MAAITITAANVSVDWDKPHEPLTLPALVAITAGQYIRPDPTTGKFDLGNATTAAEILYGYIATKSVAAGEPLTGIHYGVMNLGASLAALAFGAPIYVNDTDGVLGDAAGTVSRVAGRVIAVFGSGNATPDKLLLVDLR